MVPIVKIVNKMPAIGEKIVISLLNRHLKKENIFEDVAKNELMDQTHCLANS
jgi:hypothetical protein